MINIKIIAIDRRLPWFDIKLHLKDSILKTAEITARLR